MADRHDYVALDWVKGEISETLNQARQALEAFVETPEDSTRLRFCLTYIHQVHGTLQMVEFYGAALLAEEMEKLAQALMSGVARRDGEALDVLMQAILQMPTYLDRVQSGRRDLPLVLLPLLNDMRTARGEKLLSENALFSPEIEVAGQPESSSAEVFDADAVRQLRKLRQALQMLQANIIREQDLPSSCQQLGKVFARLETLCRGRPHAELWTIFAGLAEGLEYGSIDNGASVRQLLRQADRELRQLQDQASESELPPPPPELIRNLLFYVAKSPGGSPRLDALKQRYQLQALLSDADRAAQASGSRLVGPDRSALHSVVLALNEELLQVKDQLDLFVRGDRSQPDTLSGLLPTMKQIADTLAMLGLGQPRRVLGEQIERLQELVGGTAEINDTALMDVAGGLLFVEASLQGIAGLERQDGSDAATGEEAQRLAVARDMLHVQQQVVTEARNALEQTREAINAFIANQWDHAHLAPVDDLLNSIRGGLAMLPLERAAQVIALCRRYINERLLAERRIPDWVSLDALADVITSIDYYLERLAEDDTERSDGILAVAEERLKSLGFDPAAPFESQAEPETPQAGIEPVSSAAPESEAEEQDDELDAELVEIFVEEAGEVLETLAEFTPQWQADPEDRKPLAEVRRAFHTLKGSGRMVKATILAELAWSVENMLNRVIDRSIELGDEVFQVVNAVRALMPQLVEDFAGGVQQTLPEVSRLSAWADALSQGETEVEASLSEAMGTAESEPQTESVTEPLSGSLPVVESEELELTDWAETASEGEELLAPVAEFDTAPEPEADAAVAQLPADDSSGMDPILLEIFRNEAQAHLEQVESFVAQCAQGLPRPASDALQRALHTLKGSAHMAGIQPIAQLATPLEKLIKDFKANLVPVEQSLVELLCDALALIRVGIAQLDYAPQQPIAGTEALLVRVKELHEQGMKARDASRADLENGRADAGLLSIFLTEGVELLLDAGDQLQADPHSIDSQALVGSLRALGEVAGEVELEAIEQLCQALEDVHGALYSGQLSHEQVDWPVLAEAHERLITMMDQVAAHQHVASAQAEIEALQGLLRLAPLEPALPLGNVWHPEQAGTDPELVEIFLEEAQEIIDSAAASLQQWLADTDNTLAVESLQRDLHTLKGGARMAEIRPVGDLAHELEYLYEGLGNQRYQPSAGLADLLHACHDSLAEMVEGVVANRAINDGQALIACIRAFRVDPEQPPRLPEQSRAAVPPAKPSEPVPVAPAPAPSLPGMLQMFLEEGRDLLLPCDELLARRDEAAASQELSHRLQTFKGSARLAGQHTLAEQAKSLEQALSAGASDEALYQALAQLQNGLELLAGQDEEPAPVVWTPMPAEPAPAAALPTAAEPEQPTLAEVKALLRQAMEAGEPAQSNGSRGGAQESVKVSASLLEELVNLAGETSIFRGRIEQQVNDLSQTLGDVESTIERVRDQLRRLDMETQAQILSRHHEETGQDYDEFDPLEMDRYSQLQQLSRSLFESASDLLDLKETLASRARDAETLLLQQARVNTELQEGLMRTRMVPFDRLLPRLRRVVRQVSSELGKQVELQVDNAEGEMDRSVLERMIGPLEHMLRNAIDHGIELPDRRLESGKSEQGQIVLDLRREGGDIVLTLADDGAGIRLEAVRQKAIERGLMDVDADLSDQEVLQFILEAGFSTAEQVTQISGRGVGMDVVNAEVKQLGGSMLLATEPGQGTTFTIRLPFTVSVNRALMVYSGEDLYAIPLNTVEGIVRVSGYELEAYYAPDAPPFEYAGKRYDLRYLGDLLVTGQQPKLSGHSLPLPVILVRSAEHSVAVQVDALAGSREIVVKGLGKQFAVVPGISGATILGDGRVVVILDLLAVIRAQQAHSQLHPLVAQDADELIEERPPLVMVVDDSITVRKVTSRLLERHGMEAVTAKDGVEAIAKLQEIQPDVVLLDIEMPRMDGFEVATLIRHDERLRDLPIIMITSRTGEKHRERALSIGVNDYLGKPYQEAQLLERIEALVAERG